MDYKLLDKPDGFHEIPGNDFVWISRDGRCVNRLTGNPITVSRQSTGYLSVVINTRGIIKNFYHHRLMALAFVKRPARHLDKSYDELEINHLDGSTDNNHPSNLEWCTPEENIQHAIENGLKSYDIVLAKDISSNEVKRFLSAAHCARAFEVSHKRMSKHLKSKLSGYVTRNNHVFKLDDGSSWPFLRDEHYKENTWEQQFGAWVATNVEEPDKTVIAHTLRDMCTLLNLDFATTQVMLSRQSLGTPYRGWVILFDDYYLHESIERSRRFAHRKIFAPKKVEVKNLLTSEITVYDSRIKAAEALETPVGNIRYAVQAKQGLMGDYRITEH